ncbi:hypothetical protein ACVIHH_002960 [Bradyrhizobium sp. USDA 4518]
MAEKWFSNRGQLIEIGIAAAALALGVYASDLPVRRGWEGFVAIWPIYVFPLAALVLVHLSMRGMSKKLDEISAAKSPVEKPVERQVEPAIEAKSPTSLLDLVKLPDSKWLLDDANIETVCVSVGSYWETGATYSSNKLRISPLAIDGEPGERKADVGFKYGGIVFHGGEHVTEISTNRFMMPIATSGFQSEERMVYEYSFSDEHVQFLAIRVDGVDSHSQEVIFQVARVRVSFRVPRSSDPK